MYYTGIDPRTMKPVYVARDPHDKALQRAMLQWKKPQNRRLVLEALHKTGRTDLIGYGKECLIRPDGPAPWERLEKGRKPEKGRPQGRKQERGRGSKPERRGKESGRKPGKAGSAGPGPQSAPRPKSPSRVGWAVSRKKKKK